MHLTKRVVPSQSSPSEIKEAAEKCAKMWIAIIVKVFPGEQTLVLPLSLYLQNLLSMQKLSNLQVYSIYRESAYSLGKILGTQQIHFSKRNTFLQFYQFSFCTLLLMQNDSKDDETFLQQ